MMQRRNAIVVVVLGGLLGGTCGTALHGQTGKPTGDDPERLKRIRTAKMPAISKPVQFDTPEADAICAALEVFPPDNPWNLVVENWPVHPNSQNIVASIGAGKPLRYDPDMSFILVPPDQKKVNVKIVSYPDESDKGPFAVPDNLPIEMWPVFTSGRPSTRTSPYRTCSATGCSSAAIATLWWSIQLAACCTSFTR